MAQLDQLMKALDSAQWELTEGFKGLPDEDVWKRPHPRLLSVGEIAAHIAYWEARSFLEEDFESPLAISAGRYYTTNMQGPFALEMGALEVIKEVGRVHEACKAAFEKDPRDSEEPNPKRGDWTWGETVSYQVFHVAYHTGQIFSARHLLGHETVDN